MNPLQFFARCQESLREKIPVSWICLVVLCSLANPAGAEFTVGEINTRTENWKGLVRPYEVYVPTGYDGREALPLLVDIHGFGSNAAQQRGISQFLALADLENFIVVWPQGAGFPPSWNGGICCGGAAQYQVDDVGLMRRIVERVAVEANIDLTRIYATGLSNGGAMSHRLSCEAADLFAATAPMAFPMSLDPMSSCSPSRPIPVAMVMGLTDIVVPYNPSWFPGALESFEFWRETNGCRGETPQLISPLGPSNLGDARCETYTSCDGGVETRLCSVVGSVIPGFEIYAGHILYFNNSGYGIAADTWDFLAKFKHPHPGEIVASETASARKEARERAARVCAIREHREVARDKQCRFRAARYALRKSRVPDTSACEDRLHRRYVSWDSENFSCSAAAAAEAMSAANQEFIDDIFAALGLDGESLSRRGERCAGYLVRAAESHQDCHAKATNRELHERDATVYRDRCDSRFEANRDRALRRFGESCPAVDVLEAHLGVGTGID